LAADARPASSVASKFSIDLTSVASFSTTPADGDLGPMLWLQFLGGWGQCYNYNFFGWGQCYDFNFLAGVNVMITIFGGLGSMLWLNFLAGTRGKINLNIFLLLSFSLK
jgi:hypothetical protein